MLADPLDRLGRRPRDRDGDGVRAAAVVLSSNAWRAGPDATTSAPPLPMTDGRCRAIDASKAGDRPVS